MDARDFARIDADEAEAWWPALVALYREEAAFAAEPAEAAALLCEAARICAEHLDDAHGAQALAEEAQATQPGAVEPLRLLADLAEAAADGPAAARWLEAWLEAEPDEAAKTLPRVRLAAVLQDALGDHAAALPHLRAALHQDPTNHLLLVRLDLACPPDDGHARLDVLERRLGVADAPDDRGALLVQIARIHELVFDDDVEALRNYRAALEASPTAAEALDGVVRLHMRQGRWADLVTALMHGFTIVDDDEARGRLLYLCALINVTRLNTPERARLFLGQAALLLGHDRTAVRELVADYEQLGMWGPANTLLEQMAESADRDEVAAAWYRAGLNAESGMGQPELAAEAYAKALRADPAYLPALGGLRRCAWRADDLERYVAVTEGLADGARTPGIRAALRTHLAAVVELRLGDDERALALHGAALEQIEHAVGDGPLPLEAALQARVRLLWARRNWPVLEEQLTRLLGRALTPSAESWVRGALAELEEVELDRPAEAAAQLRALTALQPDDAAALRALQRLLIVQRDRPALVDALRREAETADPPRRLALATREAEAHEALGQPEAVERCWRAALELDPAYLPALRGLGRLLYQHGRWRDLAALHREELDTLPSDDPQRAGLLGKLAELYEFRLAEATLAAEAYERVLALRPQAPDALAGLERLYGGMERWEDLARVLAARAADLTEPGDRAAVLFRLAELRHEHIGDLEGALDAYEASLTLRPDLLPAAWALERLVVARGDRERLVLLYRDLLPRLRSPGQRAVVAHKLAALLPPAEARPLLGELAEEHDIDAAWGLVREAAELGDRAMLVERLARMAQRVGDRRDAYAFWLEAAEWAEDAELPAEDRHALWERVAPLAPDAARPWEARLNVLRAMGDRAAEADVLVAYARVAADARARSVGLWSAARLHAAAERPVQAADLVEEAATANKADPVPLWLQLEDGRPRKPVDRAALLDAAGRATRDPVGASALLTEAGRTFAAAGDEDRALAAYIEAVRRDAHAEVAAEQAGELLTARGGHAELAALLERRIRRLEAPDELAPLLHALADVQLDHLRDRERACATFARLVELDPTDLDARIRLADLLYSVDRYRDAAVHYRKAADQAHDERVLVRLYTRLGQIKAYQLSDYPGAIEDLRRAVGLLDPDGRALEALAAVYLMADEAELARLAYQRLERLADDPARLGAARAGQVKALIAQSRQAEAVERLKAFREADPVDPLLQALAREILAGEDFTSPSLRAELQAQAGMEVEAALGPAPEDISLLETAGEMAIVRPLALTGALSGDEPAEDEHGAIDAAPLDAPRVPPPPLPTGALERGAPTASEAAVADAEGHASAAPGAWAPPAMGGPPAIDPLADLPEDEVIELDSLDAALEGLTPMPSVLPGDPDEDEEDDAALDDGALRVTEEQPVVPPAGLRGPPPAAPGPTAAAGPPPARLAAPTGPPPAGHPAAEGATRPPSPPVPAPPVGDDAPPSPSQGEDESRQTMPYGMPILVPPPGGPTPAPAPPPAAPARGVQSTETGMPIQLPQRSAPAPSAPAPSAPPPEAREPESASVDELPSGLGTLPPAGGALPGGAPIPAAPADPSTAVAADRLARDARGALEADPLDLDAWRALQEAVERGASEAATAWVRGVRAWVEGEVRPASPRVPPGALPEALRRPLLPSSVPTNLLLLLRAVGPSLAAAFGSGRSRTADGSDELVSEQSKLHAMARRLATAIEVPTFRLVRNAARPYTVTVEPDVPTTLVLGTAIVDGADDTGRSFLLARCLVPLREGTLAARKLSDREFRAFLGALLGLLGAEYPIRPRDRATADRLRSQLQPVIEANRQPAWDALARTAASGLGTFPPAAVRAGLETYTARLALALADGFGGAFEMLRLLDFDDRPREALQRADLGQFLADSDVARDLLVFAGSPACLAIRTWLATT